MRRTLSLVLPFVGLLLAPAVAAAQANPWGAVPPPPPLVVAPQPGQAYGYQAPVYNPPVVAVGPYAAAVQGEAVRYQGGPLPPGTRLEQRGVRGLIIAGIITLGATYGVSAMVGLIGGDRAGDDEYAPAVSLIPLVGPALYGAGLNYSSTYDNTSGRTMLYLLSAGQVVGAGLLVLGLVLKQDWVVPSTRVARRAPSFALLPGTAGSPLGATLTLTHF